MSELLSTMEDLVVKEEPPDEVKFEPDSWGVLKVEPSEETTVKDEVDLEPIKFVPVDMQYVMPSCKKEETSGETERGDGSDQKLQDSDENDSYEQTEDYQGPESSEEIEDSVGFDEIPDSNSYTAPRVQLESGAGRKQQPDSLYYKLSTSQVAPEVRKLAIPRKCNICKKTFAIKANYYSHINTHIAEPTSSRTTYFLDPQDDCVSDTAYSIITDQEDPWTTSVDDNDSRSHRSDTCNKYFKNRNQLEIHTMTHTSEIPYSCGITTSNNNANNRMRSNLQTYNTKTRTTPQYQCEVCNNRFKFNSDFKRHTRTHTGERPFECHICNKCFAQSSHLKSHMMTHTGERPYHCEVCNKCFNTNGGLKLHTRTHTGEQPYHCEICNKRFKTNRNLKKHENSHR